MLPQLSEISKRGLAGNAISVPVAGALISYILGTVERREVLQLGRTMTCLAFDDGYAGGDEDSEGPLSTP
eukprot:9982527-Alexandrium_andersonii.AAC.1